MLIKQSNNYNNFTNNNGPIVAKNVKAIIDNISLIDEYNGILGITLKITDERYTGRVIMDKVSYIDGNSLNWKYFNIRESAGVPYNASEPRNIDIEELLLNKTVTMNLSTFDGMSRNGARFTGQKINYVVDKNNYNYIDTSNYAPKDSAIFSDEELNKTCTPKENGNPYHIRRV